MKKLFILLTLIISLSVHAQQEELKEMQYFGPENQDYLNGLMKDAKSSKVKLFDVNLNPISWQQLVTDNIVGDTIYHDEITPEGLYFTYLENNLLERSSPYAYYTLKKNGKEYLGIRYEIYSYDGTFINGKTIFYIEQ